ncbi:type 4 pilus major pilin [Cupriavidus basilensis]|jgi:hypothetical protein|uniref:type 4 pilus major pilin n=1 Tax=Cupriavidus basilensis TaxID=68895 RepID=UPI0023E7C19E|nr:type 4 pilus major pilin [Cupriavidus basilensis]MDF3883111.1 type 4 pilus major pilin [Cupriavidus basilensis]
MEGILGRIIATVLGLIALAGVGYAAYNGFSNSKSSDVVTGVTTIVTNARSQFAAGNTGYTNFTTANAASLVTAGIIPTSWVATGNVPTDPWGNALAFASAGANTQGSVTFGGGGSETQAQCINVIQNLKDYISLTAGTKTFTQTALPDPVSAAAACTAAGTKITLVFQ